MKSNTTILSIFSAAAIFVAAAFAPVASAQAAPAPVPSAVGSAGSQTVRVRDIVSYAGAGKNMINGYGLVIGLKGTGDKNSVEAMNKAKTLAMKKEGLEADDGRPAANYASPNIAYVHVSATIDENSTVQGSRITCTVSIVDQSKSLTGGELVSAELTFRNKKEILAEASGLLIVPLTGGGGAGGGGGKSNTTATVEAILLRNMPEITFFDTIPADTKTDENGEVTKTDVIETMTLSLNDPDMNTAISIARNINDSVIDNLRANQNRAASVDVAKAIGPGRVDVTIPKAWHGREAEFRHLIENVSVNPDTVAKVTIHRKTGDFVITGNVRVKPGAVSVGGVSISTTPQGALPAQPAPGSVVTDPIIPVNQPDASLMDFLSSLNALNLTKEEKAQLLRNLATDKLLIGKFEDKD